ncbi:DUF2889 domain-containing protein [Orrella sp. JC864]|uniref:DUF2889 domain-containing protein n=1 Tax=Orrella sp. JC864 TaxID=3120298 RepID=UPI0012BC3F00
MPLSSPTVERQPLHTRSIRIQSYGRADGLWDMEAELIDTKAYDFETRGRLHRAGAPVHHMHLRVTFDAEYTIVAAEAAYDAAPYGQACSCIEPDYERLVGLNLLRGFRQRVRERFGRVQGCTHMTELSFVLPTAAVQTMANRRREQADTGQRPFQLDGCHALRVDGAVAREFYPRWYQAPEGARGPQGADVHSSSSHPTDR